MKNMKFWRTALVATLVLTVMLSVTGGTIAWFTDTVTSESNVIKAGNLEVTMNWADGKNDPATTAWTDAADANAPIFNNNLWEPGYAEVRHVKIANAGSLALKYNLEFEADGVVSKLAEVIDVLYLDENNAKAVANRSDLAGMTKLGTLKDFINQNDTVKNSAAGHLSAGQNHTVTIALKMQESAGNEYQDLEIGSSFKLILRATQYTEEEDSFGKDYDENALYVNPDQYVSTFEELESALAANEVGYIMLTDDIQMTKVLSPNDKDFVLDGNGHTITMADTVNNTIALFDITRGNVTIKNVTFDGIVGASVVRTVDTDFTLDNVTVQNCVQNVGQPQGMFRLLGKSTIKNSTFTNNTCYMLISMGYDGANDNPLVVKNSVFENNTCSITAVVYYANGSACTLDGNKFLNNTVTTSNGATVYLGFKKNTTTTNNVFRGNTVTATSKRSAAALMIGNAAVVSNNTFVDNTLILNDVTSSRDVCVSPYYAAIDISNNYWGGHAPVENDDYYVEYNNYPVTVAPYLTEDPNN